jgi:hypothetical protein
MQFSFNLLRIKGLYMFRALLAHPQEALGKWHLVYCVCIMSVGCGTTWCNFHSINWMKIASHWFHYTDILWCTFSKTLSVIKITVTLYVTPCSLVEQQQCFRKTSCVYDGTRWRPQAPLLTSLNMRSLRSQKTVCRGGGHILILHRSAAYCQCHLLTTQYYNPPPRDNSLCCKQHNIATQKHFIWDKCIPMLT